MPTPLVVLIAANGQPELLRRTLQSFTTCAKPAGYCGVVVIENGPRAGLENVVASFSTDHQFRYLYSAAANKSRALNLALQMHADALALFTDSDIQIPPETLLAYSRAASGRQDRKSTRLNSGHRT